MFMHKTGITYFVCCLFILCLTTKSAFSQQGNNWYFGEMAGITFNTNPPSALMDGKLNTYEGCTSISDATGNLLFYTDGSTVYNRNHVIMPNGTGLLGGASSTSSGIVIPKPGSNTIYYLFTAEPINATLVTTYAYSEIDMQLDGGLGDVVASKKNIVLYTPATERLAAVKHANGIDYWIITKRFGDNRFLVYQVSCTGVNTTPVVSSIGFVPTGIYDAIGALKVSPNGKKVCMAVTGGAGQLFDFDIATGMLSNLVELTGYTFNRIYGVEFSPNSKKLYISSNANWINQYDITSNDPAVINASKYGLTTASGDANEALQLGPDKKIYVASWGRTKLHVINDPDIAAPGCNLQLSAVDLGGRRAFFGLPTYISSFFNNSAQAGFTHTFNNCQVQFTGTSTLTGNLQWYWDFGDGTHGTGQSVAHTYATTGSYNVKLKVIPVGICILGDSVLVTHPVLIEQDITKKVDFSHTFNNCQVQFSGTTDFTDNLQWLWDFGDGTTGTGQSVNHIYTRLGSYTVTITGQPVLSCPMYDTMVFTKLVNIAGPPSTIDFTNSFTNCQVHFAGTSNYAGSLLWQWDLGNATTATGQLVHHTYNSSGTYPVTLNGIKITNCPVNDTLTVTQQVPIHINVVTVNAGADTTIFYNLPYHLNAVGSPANVSYTWSPVTGLNNPFIADPVTTLRTDINYTVTVTDENGCTATDYKAIKVFGNPEVYIPNAFTPNGDGKNDILKPLGFGLQQLVYFRIYNRYGQLVFQSNTLDAGWDGTFKGKLQPAGTYTYMVKVINYRGWPVEQKGTLIIIR